MLKKRRFSSACPPKTQFVASRWFFAVILFIFLTELARTVALPSHFQRDIHMSKLYSRRLASPLLLTLLLVLHAPASHADSASTTAPASVTGASEEVALAARIDSEIAPLFKANEPGATVIVTQAGLTVFRKAYGMADVAKGLPMTPDTVMRIASISKQFTATGILMLADEGKLALDDDIQKFLPDYPSGGKRITIEHLLTHTSGIANFTNKPTFEAGMNTDQTVSQMIDSFKNDALQFEPGTRYSYSNSGYFLLGAIIEKVSGLSYAKFVEQRIFVPLGMRDSAYEGHERGSAMRAKGYTRSSAGSGFEPGKAVSMTLPYAAGALVSTVDDLARWDAAVSAGTLLKPSSQQKAFTAHVLADGKSVPYGYGWSVRKMRGMPMQSHGGGIPGFSTYALRLPEKQLYVAVLTNADRGLPGAEMIAVKAATIAVGNGFPE
ncbi:serine hydrolase [Janthinobacterium sp. SUN026]|uniref:serine hydrolase domain-containing protein n=1 Tax=Janthinobacterium sp. SUN026 TaxID=3002438 RepID=UPI0025B06241|nr:serine hydrolase domain-containing protein [Janthinobacterium sp. SUN026]MDN2673878.1 serine hydrolase [Janthinobacterium sp. SUN026]